MTLYRDDIQETIAYSNNTIGKSKAVTEELIRIKEDSLYRLAVFSGDVVLIADEFVDSAIYLVRDSVAVSEMWTGRKLHKDFITEKIVVSERIQQRMRAKTLMVDHVGANTLEQASFKLSTKESLLVSDNVLTKKLTRSIVSERLVVAEQFKTKMRAKSLLVDVIDTTGLQQLQMQRGFTKEQLQAVDVHNNKKFSSQRLNERATIRESIKNKALFKAQVMEQAAVGDVVLRYKLRAKTIESIMPTELYQTKKIAYSIVNESVRVVSGAVAHYADFVIDYVNVVERYSQRFKGKQHVIDALSVADTVSQKRLAKQKVDEVIVFADLSQGKNFAKQLINDLIFVEDDHAKEKQYGYAWTANVDTWAMSRYQDYGFSELVVIDEVLYGVAEDGVHQLDANELIEAKLVTGQLDLGQGQLVHPLGAYLEYELSGNSKKLEVGVTTTQSGIKQTFSYLLPIEKADYLTNGRVLFGRGLRGRHFAFELKITGEHGYINDLSIDMSATKRRV